MSDKKFPLVTRSDMDALVCVILLKEKGIVDEITFAHPKDMQDEIIDITENDIITNLPHYEQAHLVFDHHDSEMIRVEAGHDNHIIDPCAPSAARVVYDYYDGKEAFSNVSEDMMMDLIDYCREHQDINKILELVDVKERVDFYFEYSERFREQLKRCSEVKGKVAVLDLRNEDAIYAGNRFMLYAVFPDTNMSAHVMWGREKQNTVFAVGKSILDRSGQIDVGNLMLKYGGGGHKAAGTYQVANDKAEQTKKELVNILMENRNL